MFLFEAATLIIFKLLIRNKFIVITFSLTTQPLLAMQFAVSSLINMVSRFARFNYLGKPSLLARRLVGRERLVSRNCSLLFQYHHLFH
jgi:hypothetical protein